jgi:hypothetical protein
MKSGDFETFGNKNNDGDSDNDTSTVNDSPRRRSRSKRRGVDSDFISMFSDLFNGVNYKVAILLFILGIIIFSDSFIECFLIGFAHSVDGDVPTTKGTMIQLILLTLGYVVVDLMVASNIL